MASYIVRFQFDNGTNGEYTRLKTIVEQAGFSKVIRAENGIAYYLPQGTYIANTNSDKNQVLDVAISCARRIRRLYSIHVTQSNGQAWTGLSKA